MPRFTDERDEGGKAVLTRVVFGGRRSELKDVGEHFGRECVYVCHRSVSVRHVTGSKLVRSARRQSLQILTGWGVEQSQTWERRELIGQRSSTSRTYQGT